MATRTGLIARFAGLVLAGILTGCMPIGADVRTELTRIVVNCPVVMTSQGGALPGVRVRE